MSQRVTQAGRQVVTAGTRAERVTQAGRQAAITGTRAERVTQAGRQVALAGDRAIRVTQAGRQVAYVSEYPERPSILSVSNVTAATADVTSSAYLHLGGTPHGQTRYQVQYAGGDWSALVADTWLGAVTSGTLGGLLPLLAYQVRAAYADDEGDWSEWSNPYYFISGSTATSGDFDWDDWAHLWNIGQARYRGNYVGAGGWHGPVSWEYFGSYDPAAGLTGDPCYGVGPVPASGYNGNVMSLGRLFGQPSVLANTALGPNSGVNVAARLSWYSGQSGFSWERYWDCEMARHGVAALVCGTCEPIYPSLGWNVWEPFTPGGWPCTDDMQGIVAYIAPNFSWPYVPCMCCPAESIVDQVNWLLMTCYHYGLALSSQLVVQVWFNGELQQSYSYDLPWKVVFSQTWPICTVCYDTQTWACRHFPWYGIRLKVWKDMVSDPTGKTHRIQAACTSPPTEHHGGSDDAIHVEIEGDWGTGQANLPGENGPWMIDETWVGGHDETVQGEGDGGLRCGWSGYCSDRWTGGEPTNTSGANVYKDFTAQVLDTANCDTPCDANYIPGNGEIIPPEPLKPLPALSPCPPDQETADKQLFIGGTASAAGLFRFGGYEVEAGRAITARIRPNPVAPEGYGGECLFKNIVIVCEHYSDIHIAVTPILNGERLDAYTQERTFIGPGDRATLQRYLVPLYRSFEDGVVEGTVEDRFKYGLRGAYFSFEMKIVDLCGIGLQLPGVWIEYEPVRETQNTGVVYTQDLLRVPAFIPSTKTFVGAKGHNRLLKALSGTTDDGVQIQARVFTNPVAPEGEGGECLFKRLSVVVTRWNTNAMDLVLTPYLDGDPLPPITVNYKATTAPVTEITEVSLAQYYRRLGADALERFRYGARGAWFHLKIETGSGLQEWLTLEGVDLDYEPVRPSLQTDVRS